jgi:hypothetical protein
MYLKPDRLPKVIKIIMQREKLEYNKKIKNKNKNKTTILERQPQQQQKKKEEEDYSPRVKSLKDFVQLFEKKRKRVRIREFMCLTSNNNSSR